MEAPEPGHILVDAFPRTVTMPETGRTLTERRPNDQRSRRVRPALGWPVQALVARYPALAGIRMTLAI